MSNQSGFIGKYCQGVLAPVNQIICLLTDPHLHRAWKSSLWERDPKKASRFRACEFEISFHQWSFLDGSIVWETFKPVFVLLASISKVLNRNILNYGKGTQKNVQKQIKRVRDQPLLVSAIAFVHRAVSSISLSWWTCPDRPVAANFFPMKAFILSRNFTKSRENMLHFHSSPKPHRPSPWLDLCVVLFTSISSRFLARALHLCQVQVHHPGATLEWWMIKPGSLELKRAGV